MKYAISISERQSRRVLEQAVRMQSQLLIEPTGMPDRTMLGFVASGDADVVVAELTGPPHPWLRSLTGRTVGVQLFVQERYLFESCVLAGPSWHDGEQLTLTAPRVLQVVQRRRFWRAQLAPSIRVALHWRNGGRPQHTHCPLLNVSAEGLACKLDAGAAQALGVGNRVSCEFRLPGANREIRLDAVVRNCSPASDDTWIVGVEFELNPADPGVAAAQQELRDILYRPQFAMSGVESE